jgi:hypothetical protein
MRAAEWYNYSFILACLTILLSILAYRKLTKQKGKWTNNFGNMYRFAAPEWYHSGAVKQKDGSKGEIECRKYLETVFQKPFPKIRPRFLQNPITGNNLEIDCFNASLKLGVEYNGVQHYKFTPRFHKNSEALMTQKYRDEIKRRLCVENGITLIEVPYTIRLNDIGPYINLQLEKKGFYG